MNLAQHALWMFAGIAIFTYVCRLSMMSWKTTSPMILVMHLSLAMATIWSGYRGWIGDADPGDFATVVGSLAWISVSYRTWKFGVPEHFNRSRPMELDEADLHSVWGRGDR
jgi:cell division protein FtsW (lipid II flippase)